MITNLIYDTIAAISTPPGEGGIGIVRISGPDSFRIIKEIFKPHKKDLFKKEPKSFKMYLGYITENKNVIDEVLVSFMKAPHTYTREDIVEINCHGGAVAVNEVLRLVLEKGARLAEPGEFTKRAFINGRIDLSQAEAVLDIVKARTKESLRLAVNQLSGNLSKKIRKIMEDLKNILVILEANIDFPEEEDVSSLDYKGFFNTLKDIKKELKNLIDSYDTGKIYREGIRTVLAGKPNVGKSSILNSFLRYDRAIVTPIPGTTRDVIEEQLNINGIPFILADTAGITESSDIVEKEGIKRAESYLNSADLIIAVFDNSSEIDKRDIFIIEKIKGKTFIPVINKVDLNNKLDIEKLSKILNLSHDSFVYISAKTGKGLNTLEKRMENLVKSGKSAGSYSIMITSSRHYASLKKAYKELEHAIKAIKENLEPELLAFDITNTIENLGEITGEVSKKEIIDSIFEQFCIGK